MVAPTLADIQRELSVVHTTILAAQNTLKTGEMPNIAGLENHVGEICKAVQNLPPDAQEKCLEDMKNLLKDLDLLAIDMKNWMITQRLPV